MNDLLRPAMYDAWHGVVPLAGRDAVRDRAPVDVVGPVCESADTFARARALPLLSPGARVALLDAGAYGAVMSSTYNARPLAPIAMVDGDRWAVIRDRQLHADLWAGRALAEFIHVKRGTMIAEPAKTEEKRRCCFRLAPATRPGPRGAAVRARLAGAVAGRWGGRGRSCAPPCWTCRRPAAGGARWSCWWRPGWPSRGCWRAVCGGSPAERGRGGPAAGARLGVAPPAARGAGGPPARWPARRGCGRAHVARAVAQLGRLRVGLPRPGLAARDRRALRGAAGGGAGRLPGDRRRGGARCGWRAPCGRPGCPPPAPPATELQAWITPPAYTGLAPVFLKNEGGAVSVPAGSHLTVSVTGGSGEPSLALAGATRAFQALDCHQLPGRCRAACRRAAGGAARRAGDRGLGPDRGCRRAARGVLAQPPGPARGGGRVPQTRLPWQVSHDYGVTSLDAELRLRDRPDAPALVVPIPLPGGSPKSAKGVRVQDLTAHPWAGLPVHRAAGGARRAGADRHQRRGKLHPAGAAGSRTRSRGR